MAAGAEVDGATAPPPVADGSPAPASRMTRATMTAPRATAAVTRIAAATLAGLHWDALRDDFPLTRRGRLDREEERRVDADFTGATWTDYSKTPAKAKAPAPASGIRLRARRFERT